MLQPHDTSLYIQFNHLQRSVLVINVLITTVPHFNVLSGVLTECLVEPWQVGVRSTAGSLYTNTLLSIPQEVISVKVTKIATSEDILSCLTVVVTANKGRDRKVVVTVTGAFVVWII